MKFVKKLDKLIKKVTRMELIFRQSCSLKACKFHKTALLYMFFSNIFLLKLQFLLKIFQPFKFFLIWIFFHEHSRITGLQGKEEGISLTPHYHFHSLHRHLHTNRVITAESSPLLISNSRTRTRNL